MSVPVDCTLKLSCPMIKPLFTAHHHQQQQQQRQRQRQQSRLPVSAAATTQRLIETVRQSRCRRACHTAGNLSTPRPLTDNPFAWNFEIHEIAIKETFVKNSAYARHFSDCWRTGLQEMRFIQRPVLCVDAFVWTNNGVVNLF